MKNLFVPYELALALKEKGFDGACIAYYSHRNKELYPRGQSNGAEWQYVSANTSLTLKAPFYQQVIDWVREKHEIDLFLFKLKEGIYKFDVHKSGESKTLPNPTRLPYYEALNKAIEEALKLI